MSRRSTESEAGGGFLRKLAWTVLLALVFSAGLITGQRMIRSETKAPLVSVTSEKEANEGREADASESDDEAKQQPLFSFYERLSAGSDSADESHSAEPPNGDDSPEQPSADREASASDSTSEQGEQEANEETETGQRAQAPDTPESSEKPTPETTDDSPARQADEAADRDGKDGADDDEAADRDAPGAAKYTLQVSAYSSLDRARSRVRKLSSKGLDAHVVSAEVPDKGTYYRVHIGKFESMKTAEKFQAELRRKRAVDTFLTPL